MVNEQHIYLMPGLGANSLIFEYLKFPKRYSIHLLDWIMPIKNESLKRQITKIFGWHIANEKSSRFSIYYRHQL